MTFLALCLILDYIVGGLGVRKARLYVTNISAAQSQSQTSSGELGDVGEGGRLEVRWTPPLYVCVHILLPLPSAGGAWSMVLVL